MKSQAKVIKRDVSLHSSIVQSGDLLLARKTNGRKTGIKSDNATDEPNATDQPNATPATDAAQADAPARDPADPSAKTGDHSAGEISAPSGLDAPDKAESTPDTGATEPVVTESPSEATENAREPSPGADGQAASPDAVQPDAEPSTTSKETSTGDSAPAASLSDPGPFSTSQAEAATAPVVAPPPAPPPEKKGGFFPLLLGGLVAGGIGYGTHFYLTEMSAGEDSSAQEIASLQAEVEALQAALSDRAEAAELSAVQSEVAETQSALAELRDDLGAAAGAAELDALEMELAELQAAFSELPGAETLAREISSGRISALAETVAQTEADLADARSEIAIVPDLQAQVAALQAELADLRDLAERRVVEAEAEVDTALARSGLQIMTAALAGGRSYADALDLFESAGVTVPETLAAPAATGVPTLETLQEDFPAAARAALRAELAEAPSDSAYDRVSNFLRAQTGARSTAPRDGDDTDAILSRAGAAVEAEAFADALDELAALTGPAQSAMQGWITAVETRLSADAALAEFTTSLSNE